jgi:tetratricopeptide (TPR) repeat protein
MGEAVETANSITRPEVREIMLKLIKADNVVHDAGLSASNLNEIVKQLWNLGEELDKIPIEVKWNYPIAIPYSEAGKVLDREWMILAQKFPEDLSARYNAATWQLNSGRYDNAAGNFRAVLALPNLPDSARTSALTNLGVALLRAGQVAQAEAPLRAALAQAQLDPDANCALLEVLQRSGRAGESGQFAAACRQQVPQ